MNRYLLHIPRPRIKNPTITPGQIWRAKYYQTEPMLIEIGQKSISDVWEVFKDDYPQPGPRHVFHMTTNQILSEYVIDE